MLMLRLQRLGKSKQPSYRLIVSDKRRDTQHGATEILGTYNPLAKEGGVNFKEDRVKYWLSVGAQASPTVHNMLIKSGVIKGDKKKSVALSGKRRAAIAEKKAKEAPAPAAAPAA